MHIQIIYRRLSKLLAQERENGPMQMSQAGPSDIYNLPSRAVLMASLLVRASPKSILAFGM